MAKPRKLKGNRNGYNPYADQYDVGGFQKMRKRKKKKNGNGKRHRSEEDY